jgi:hypothetical protein
VICRDGSPVGPRNDMGKWRAVPFLPRRIRGQVGSPSPADETIAALVSVPRVSRSAVGCPSSPPRLFPGRQCLFDVVRWLIDADRSTDIYRRSDA